MAYRLADSVVELELDNREKGRVTGVLRLLGRAAPVIVDLRGNCLRDMAGSRVVFRNPSPREGDEVELLDSPQEGVVGDITGSRKVFVPVEPDAPANGRRAHEDRRPECRAAKCAYIEWFSESNGRVVIESTDFEIEEFSEPAWTMTMAEGEEQRAANVRAIRDWLERLEAEREGMWEDEEEEDDDDMDEFGWERFLKDSDARTDRFMEVMDKYEGHPDRDRLVARDMGWNWIDDAMDADSRGAFEEEKRLLEDDLSEENGLQPDPATEGVDWMRDGDGSVTHPLTLRASELSVGMWRLCRRRGLLEEDGDADLFDMVSQSQTLSSKLAGALNSLAYDHRPDGGFVVALLKRALKYFEGAVAASDVVRAKALLPPEELDPFVTELFAVREAMIALMKRYRESI